MNTFQQIITVFAVLAIVFGAAIYFLVTAFDHATKTGITEEWKISYIILKFIAAALLIIIGVVSCGTYFTGIGVIVK